MTTNTIADYRYDEIIEQIRKTDILDSYPDTAPLEDLAEQAEALVEISDQPHPNFPAESLVTGRLVEVCAALDDMAPDDWYALDGEETDSVGHYVWNYDGPDKLDQHIARVIGEHLESEGLEIENGTICVDIYDACSAAADLNEAKDNGEDADTAELDKRLAEVREAIDAVYRPDMDQVRDLIAEAVEQWADGIAADRDEN